MLETGRGHNPEIVDNVEEEVDVEKVIETVQDNCADFMSTDNEAEFEKIFDAARRTYADDRELRVEWDQLFENMRLELESADDDDIPTILANYVKKATALG